MWFSQQHLATKVYYWVRACCTCVLWHDKVVWWSHWRVDESGSTGHDKQQSSVSQWSQAVQWLQHTHMCEEHRFIWLLFRMFNCTDPPGPLGDDLKGNGESCELSNNCCRFNIPPSSCNRAPLRCVEMKNPVMKMLLGKHWNLTLVSIIVGSCYISCTHLFLLGCRGN